MERKTTVDVRASTLAELKDLKKISARLTPKVSMMSSNGCWTSIWAKGMLMAPPVWRKKKLIVRKKAKTERA
jgi:hypothetical protein